MHEQGVHAHTLLESSMAASQLTMLCGGSHADALELVAYTEVESVIAAGDVVLYLVVSFQHHVFMWPVVEPDIGLLLGGITGTAIVPLVLSDEYTPFRMKLVGCFDIATVLFFFVYIRL